MADHRTVVTELVTGIDLVREQIRIADKRSHTEVSVSREQLKGVVDCIVEPWLAKSPTTRDRSAEVSSPQARASQGKPVPVVGLS